MDTNVSKGCQCFRWIPMFCWNRRHEHMSSTVLFMNPITEMARSFDHFPECLDETGRFRGVPPSAVFRPMGPWAHGSHGPMGPHGSPWVPMGPHGSHGAHWMHPYASGCIWTYPDVSGCIRMQSGCIRMTSRCIWMHSYASGCIHLHHFI